MPGDWGSHDRLGPPRVAAAGPERLLAVGGGVYGMSEVTPEILCRIWAQYKKSNKQEGTPTKPTPRFLCADGFTVSVQVGEYSYSEPRNDRGPWESAEIGFPSESVPEWDEWAESPECLTETVYARVPLDVICAGLNRHGGLVGAVLWGLKK